MKTTSLEVRETTDIEEIKSIICDPEIYGRITDDKCPSLKDYQFQDPFDSKYIGGYIGGKIIGLLILHDGQIHFQVLKEYRKGHLKSEFLQKSLSLLDKPVKAEIPSLYPEVIDFAKREGFFEERIVKDDFIKNGKMYNRHIMVHP